MRRELIRNRLAALAAVALMLTAATSCNDHDDPELGEAVIEVTSVTTAGLSVASALDTTATLSLLVKDRSGKSTSFFNDVVLTNFTVTFDVNPPTDGTGLISTTVCPMNGTCTLTLSLVTGAEKMATLMAGDVRFATVQVEGHDVRGRPVVFEALVALGFVA